MPKPECPGLTVDIVLINYIGNLPHVLLVKRKNEPHGWALPGGFVNIGETLEEAAERELLEETRIDIKDDYLTFHKVYDNPSRDPRGHNISVAFKAVLHNDKRLPVGSDDAVEARYFPLISCPQDIVFDHREIIMDAFLKDY